MKKKYENPKVQFVFIEDPITLLSGTGTNKEIVESTTVDAITNKPVDTPTVDTGSSGDDDDESIAAKPWIMLFE